MERKLDRTHAIALGLFVLCSLGLAGVGLFAIASKDGWAKETIRLESAVSQVSGLRVGAQVRVLGIPAGQVTQVQAPDLPGEPVLLRFQIDKRHRELVRQDARVRILKDGLVGGRFVEIDPGTAAAAPVSDGAQLLSAESPNWEDVVARVDGIVNDVRQGKGTIGKLVTEDAAHQRLLNVADQGEQVLRQIGDVVGEIQNGGGTAGRLVKEDSAYRQFEDLVQRAELVLDSMEESHQALKKTWPVRSFVQDRYGLLVRPETQTHRRVFQENDLFERGSAVLTPEGKRSLDEAGKWLGGFNEWESDVVVAGFARSEEDSRLAELISTKQAEAVRDYLVASGARKRGWVSRRNITAHGFGNLPLPKEHQNAPARGIVLLAFLK